MTIQAKAERIIKDIKKEKGNKHGSSSDYDYINIHGPEHHILDGACLLVAFKNAGGEIDLDDALNKIMIEGLRMPGAMCGLWGVCGAVTSLGAALSLIDHTGPLSTDGTWGRPYGIYFKRIKELR